MNELLSRFGVFIVQQAMLRLSQQGCKTLEEVKHALGGGSLNTALEDADPPSNLLLRAYILMVLQERRIDHPDMSPDEVRKQLAESIG